PIDNAPADLEFQRHLEKVRLRVHHAIYDDETSFYCNWHAPMTHELEAWSDARAYDGSATIMQPLIAPLYQGRSAHELLAILMGQRDRSGYEIVRDYWRGVHNSADFESFWVKALNDGIVAGTASQTKAVTLSWDVANLPPST